MDFEKLLHVARKNELSKKEPVKCLQTKFKPPSKQQREKDKMLSEGVQRFLARREEEERKKKQDDERKREKLMELRAKDPKAHKRVQTMLKRTKSANKSVMEDAIDVNNTADTLSGPAQPDEDDYGFVSETSSALYNKLIQKMYNTPSDDVPKFAPSKKPKSANLLNTKERVKMALLKQEEEERMPHKRKRKNKDAKGGEDDEEDGVHFDSSAPDRDLSTNVDKEREKQRPRKPMPPPVDFQQLLKIAEQKQHEPVTVVPKVKEKEPEVLMTKRQRAEFEKLQAWKKQRELRLQSLENGTKLNNSDEKKQVKNNSKPDGKFTIPKNKESSAKELPKHSDRDSDKSQIMKNKNIKVGDSRPAEKKKVIDEEKKNRSLDDEKDKRNKIDDETKKLMRERDEALKILREKEQIIRERDEAMRKLKEREQLIRERDEALRKLKLLEEGEKKNKEQKSQKTASITTKAPAESNKEKPSINNKPSVREFPPKDVCRPTGSKDLARPSGPPNGKLKPSVRQFPPKDVQSSRQFPPPDMKRKAPPPQAKKRRVIDSDEYDSELEDFIDDGDDGCQEDVSKMISEIFKYDKNKYSRYDDDGECMESNFSQISKEEFYSTKCGILEDLKDIQREKAMVAKKKNKR